MLRLQLLLDVFKRLFFTKRIKGYETTINDDRIIDLDRPVKGCSEPVGGGYAGACTANLSFDPIPREGGR